MNLEKELDFWLMYLPLKRDLFESFDQTQKLMSLIMIKGDLILDGQSIQRLIRLFSIMG